MAARRTRASFSSLRGFLAACLLLVAMACTVAVPSFAQTTAEPFDQWSIIEAVTDPINDSMSINQFDAVATAWLSRLIAIKQDAQATPPAHLLQGSYYTGLPSAQGYGAWDRIAPQVTVGVPLDQAGKLISSFNFRGGPAREYNATQLANAAPGKAMKVMQDLLAAVPPGGVHQDGVNELRGLVTLMMNYLTAGNDDQIAKVQCAALDQRRQRIQSGR